VNEQSAAPTSQLAARAVAGDMEAFEELYRQTVGRVHAVCLRMCGNRSMAEELTQEEALTLAKAPLQEFMLGQVREKDVALFLDLTNREAPESPEDLPMLIVIPSFVLGELKMAFQIGFVLFLPFLIIDMVVASVLMSMGMMMLPPVLISLPFKVLLFVLVDGWYLIVRSLVMAFQNA